MKSIGINIYIVSKYEKNLLEATYSQFISILKPTKINTQFTSIPKPSRINIYLVSKYYKIHWIQHIHSLQAFKNPVESAYTQFTSIQKSSRINIYSVYKYSKPQLNQHTQFTSIQNPVELTYTQFTSIIKSIGINIYIVCKHYKIHWYQHIHSLQAFKIPVESTHIVYKHSKPSRISICIVHKYYKT